MNTNWSLVIFIFLLAMPGILIAIPRLINLVLPHNSDFFKNRLSRFAIGQNLLMVFLMSFAGSVLSPHTGFSAQPLAAFLQGHFEINTITEWILPVFILVMGGLIGFLILYYGAIARFLDKTSFSVMNKIRQALKPSGSLFYSGIVDEIISRWGLLNVLVFFALLLTYQLNEFVVWTAFFISAFLVTIGQFPVYLAAGCIPSRRFMYSLLVLNLWQTFLFGWIFWNYGLIGSLFGHVLFQAGWVAYERTYYK